MMSLINTSGRGLSPLIFAASPSPDIGLRPQLTQLLSSISHLR